MNCDFKKTCPAAGEYRLDGAHDGKYAGRACWIVEGTLHRGEKKDGTFAQKFDSCSQCDFYLSVKKEESGKFIPAIILSESLD